jgi:hypothetical protein
MCKYSVVCKNEMLGKGYLAKTHFLVGWNRRDYEYLTGIVNLA